MGPTQPTNFDFIKMESGDMEGLTVYFCQRETYNLTDGLDLPILRSTLLIKSDGDMFLVIR